MTDDAEVALAMNTLASLFVYVDHRFEFDEFCAVSPDWL